jgi:hypothetical protein
MMCLTCVAVLLGHDSSAAHVVRSRSSNWHPGRCSQLHPLIVLHATPARPFCESCTLQAWHFPLPHPNHLHLHEKYPYRSESQMFLNGNVNHAGASAWKRMLWNVPSK